MNFATLKSRFGVLAICVSLLVTMTSPADARDASTDLGGGTQGQQSSPGEAAVAEAPDTDVSGDAAGASPMCKSQRSDGCTAVGSRTRGSFSCPINAYATNPGGSSVSDGAVGSLRWAVNLANDTGCDVVHVHSGVHDVVLAPRIDVTDELELVGKPGFDGQRPIIQRKSPNGILSTSHDLSVEQLILDGGTANTGTAIAADCACTVRVTDSEIRNANAHTSGAGIWATDGSSLEIESTEIHHNTSEYAGAAIATAGALRLVDSTIAHNKWIAGPGNINDFSPIIDLGSGSGAVTILRSTFEGNQSRVGGVVMISGSRDALIHESRFTANTSEVDVISGAGSSAGIVSVTDGAELRMSDVEFVDNITSVGPLLTINATASVDRMSSHRNLNRVDTWIWAGSTVTIRNSTIEDSSPPVPSASPNATIAQLLDGYLRLEHVTIRAKHRTALQLPVSTGTVELIASYIEGPDACDIGGLPLATASSRFNYFTDDTCQINGEVGIQIGPPLSFTPLIPHTGFGASMAPTIGSPLIDAYPVSECTAVEDQRRFFRPNNDGCDIGAVEWYFSEGPIGVEPQ